MRSISAAIICFVSLASGAFGAIKTQVIEYKHGDVVLEGLLAYDDSTTAKRPGVVVVHEWWGNNDYARHRAEQLAQLGYAAFAIDMFGKGQVTTDPAKAGEWAGKVKADLKSAMARAQLGLDQLKNQPMVDPSKISAIGYCFGGSIVLHMARNNFPLAGVVSFHGDLSPGPTPATSIKPLILVCHGADDTFVPQTAVTAFIEEMKKASANYQVSEYSGAVHGFSNPDAGKFNITGIAYNKQADERSWREMQAFFKDIFAK